jgi:hypothetical protein
MTTTATVFGTRTSELTSVLKMQRHGARTTVTRLLLGSFRLDGPLARAGTNSAMLVHVALPEQVLGAGLGISGRLIGREIPGAALEVQRS